MSQILLTFFLFTSLTFSKPQTSCEEIIRLAKSEGIRHGYVSSISLMNSEWLKNVEAYKIEGVIIVIATIKNESSYFGKEYVFCGVPESNWTSFSYGYSGSYGERFHQYIIDYQCNCY